MELQQSRQAAREERFESAVRRWVSRRGAFPFLASTVILLTGAAGTLAWLVDRKDFHSLGNGLWWAMQTLTTVGYGDITPTTLWGRLVGAFVMALGITFLSFLTATVTSLFVSDDAAESLAALRRIEARLAAIEAALAER
jgi:voltage-gated potassium channel